MRRSENRLRAVIEGAPVGVSITTPDGVLERVNPAFAEILGYEADDLVGQSHDIFLPEDQLARLEQVRAERATHPDGALDELEVRRKDGSTVSVLSTSVPLDGGDQQTRRATFMVDISERRQSEKALAAGERRLRNLIDKAPIGVCIIDSAGAFERVNDAYAGVFGYEPADLIGQHISMVMPPDEIARAELERRRRHEERSTRLGEFDLLHRDGRRVTILTTTTHFDPTEPERRAVFAIDISERKQAEEVLQHRATHDALTGLANRMLLKDRIRQFIAHAKRHGEVVGLLFIDLDGFKLVNDRFGHEAGDALLKEISERLTQNLRDSDTVARLAGDEFVAVLPDIGSAAGAIRVADKVLNTVRTPFQVAGEPVELAASIGISLYPFDGDTLQALLRAADEAMYRAKRQGRNTYALHSVDADE